MWRYVITGSPVSKDTEELEKGFYPPFIIIIVMTRLTSHPFSYSQFRLRPANLANAILLLIIHGYMSSSLCALLSKTTSMSGSKLTCDGCKH